MKPISPFVRNLFIFLSLLAVCGHMAFMSNLVFTKAHLQMENAALRAALDEAEMNLVELEITHLQREFFYRKEICIPGSGYRKPVPLMEIVYVEAFQGQTIFYLTSNRQLQCDYGLDKAQRELLNDDDFCRVNRTFLVNRPHYNYYTPKEAKREGFSDYGKWGIVVNADYGQIKLSQSGRDRCYPKGKDLDYCH